MDMQSHLAERLRQLEVIAIQLERERAFISKIRRDIVLSAFVIYLAGIVIGVVVTKQWYGL